jgi:molecular chaperone DnaK
MVKEAAEHEAEDKRRREEIERRNKLDNLCYTLEKQVGENKEKLEASDVSSLEDLIKEGRDAVEKQDDEKVQDVLERLEKQAHELATKLYQSAGGADGGPPPGADGDNGAPGGGGSSGSGGEKKRDVIDAEFEETN